MTVFWERWLALPFQLPLRLERQDARRMEPAQSCGEFICEAGAGRRNGWIIGCMENISPPLQEAFARRFAQEWAEAWNSHDLDRILDHYDEQVILISPVALNLLNNGTGIVDGKSALREYFQRGLKAYPDLRFDLTDVLWGVETIVVYYGNNVRDGKSAEVMQVNAAGKVCRVWANYNK
jgi:hypothetical protein